MSLKKHLFESEVKKLELPSEMEAAISELHDAIFPDDDNIPDFVEKDWKSVDIDLGDGNSSIETT